MADFEGFPEQTLTFLRRLSRNNTKEWFDDRRGHYDAYWVEPAKDFVVAAGEALAKFAPDVQAAPAGFSRPTPHKSDCFVMALSSQARTRRSRPTCILRQS